jgi:hypothetical protein
VAINFLIRFISSPNTLHETRIATNSLAQAFAAQADLREDIFDESQRYFKGARRINKAKTVGTAA